MSYEAVKAEINLQVSPEDDAACRFLESRGLRFCIDFGTKNAFSMAFQVLEEEDRKEKRTWPEM